MGRGEVQPAQEMEMEIGLVVEEMERVRVVVRVRVRVMGALVMGCCHSWEWHTAPLALCRP